MVPADAQAYLSSLQRCHVHHLRHTACCWTLDRTSHYFLGVFFFPQPLTVMPPCKQKTQTLFSSFAGGRRGVGCLDQGRARGGPGMQWDVRDGMGVPVGAREQQPRRGPIKALQGLPGGAFPASFLPLLHCSDRVGPSPSHLPFGQRLPLVLL